MPQDLFSIENEESPLQDEVERRIRRLKQTPQVLLKSFDRNGDGVIDAQEWDIIRQVIASEIARERDDADRGTPGEKEGEEAGPGHGEDRLIENPEAAGEILLERYEVVGELGRGANGVTHLAYDRRTSEYVAIKELDVARIEEWKSVELFERESDVLKRLDHPGIPGFIEAFHLDDGGKTRLFLAQEFVEGENLKVRLAGGRLFDERLIADLMDRLLEILEYLHDCEPPVLHRDIKPSNLIERPDGTLALVDFGAVQTVVRDDDALGSTVVGTSGYMPPEQLMGHAIPATDLYAVGATMIHLLTRRRPSDLPASRMKLQWRQFADVREELAEFIDRLVEPAVEDRISSARQARAVVTELKTENGRSLALSQASTAQAPSESLPTELTRQGRESSYLQPVRGAPPGTSVKMRRANGRLEIERSPSEGSSMDSVTRRALLTPVLLVVGMVLIIALEQGVIIPTIVVLVLIAITTYFLLRDDKTVHATLDFRGVEARVTGPRDRTKQIRWARREIRNPRVKSRPRGFYVSIESKKGTIPIVVAGTKEEAEWVVGCPQPARLLLLFHGCSHGSHPGRCALRVPRIGSGFMCFQRGVVAGPGALRFSATGTVHLAAPRSSTESLSYHAARGRKDRRDLFRLRTTLRGGWSRARSRSESRAVPGDPGRSRASPVETGR